MNLLESLLTGLEEASRHWGQTVLALLGIVLGTGSIVTVLALFGGQAANTQKYLDEVGGVGTLSVSNRDMAMSPTARQLASDRLTYRDAVLLKQRAGMLRAVSPVWSSSLVYRVGARSFRGQVIGSVPDLTAIDDIRPLVGRGLSDLDVARRSRVIVLGWKYADSLFGGARNALGKRVALSGRQYTVVGVLEREEFYFASWERNALEYRNERGYVPITTAFSDYTSQDRLSSLTVKALPDQAASAISQIQSLLLARHGVEDFDVKPLGVRGADTGEFLKLFNYIFLVIGAVSLFTGGIVIANILLASVVERVQEFGTRMALGATGASVFAQVAAEAMVVTLLGGALGLALGLALTGTVARVMQVPVQVTPAVAALALATSGVVGMVAGLFPAIRAARLSPVEALRYG